MEVQEIKRSLNKVVRLPDGSRYKLTGATIRLNDMGEYWYQAELQDLTALTPFFSTVSVKSAHGGMQKQKDALW